MSRITHSKVAKRYAGALFAASGKMGRTERVQQDLTAVEQALDHSPDLRRVLESPLVTAERKREIIDRIFGRDLDALTLRFLHLLVDKRREEILASTREEFVRLADEARGLIRADARVASPLDDLQKAALVESLERRTGKTVQLQVTLDESLIGGAVVRMQDTVIDGSVRGALERLREEMLRER